MAEVKGVLEVEGALGKVEEGLVREAVEKRKTLLVLEVE